MPPPVELELLDEELLDELLELDEEELLELDEELLEELELDDVELLEELVEEELLELELLEEAEFPGPPQAQTRSVTSTGALHRDNKVGAPNII